MGHHSNRGHMGCLVKVKVLATQNTIGINLWPHQFFVYHTKSIILAISSSGASSGTGVLRTRNLGKTIRILNGQNLDLNIEIGHFVSTEGT